MIKAKTIMSENVVTVNKDNTIADAAKLIANKHVSCLLIKENKMPIAVITIRDIINGMVNISPKARVKDAMNKDFLIISPKTKYSYILKKLKEEKIKRFPVVENGKLVGIITETDLIDATRDFTKFHLIMQEIILAVFGLVTAFFLFLFSPLGQYIKGLLI